jgi:hypothetical protein
MMLKKTALALALGLGLVAGANATVTHITGSGAGDSIILGDEFDDTVKVGAGSFSDVYYFTIGQILGTEGQLSVWYAPDSGYSFSGDLTVNLYKGTYGDANADELKATLTKINDTTYWGKGVYDSTGDWYYTVDGTANGSKGGKYSFWVGTYTAPVPEPETYAMLLAGLGLMGTIARRRNKSKTN